MYYYRTVTVNPKLPERVSRLQELAYNFWFSWNSKAADLYAMINKTLWEAMYHNPVRFLINVQQEELDAAANDPNFLAEYDAVIAEFDKYMQQAKWFQKEFPNHSSKTIAYFSAEFGLHESLPIYSGGLGLLSGDHSKAASDLGLPFVGVGLLYKHGYFTQRLNNEGWQQAEYPSLNFAEMPIKPAVDAHGKDVIIPMDFPGRKVYLKVWKVNVGVISIYLLDADIKINNQQDRMLTAQLYGGGKDMRISQEIILGIGGVRALRALGINPYAWHINEGHAALLSVERVRELVSQGIPLATAREAVKSNTLFTTHTPVPAGHDVFDYEMVERYLHNLYTDMGMSKDDFMKLGTAAGSQGFNMTLLAMNFSAYTNGVSKLHGCVSRKMFHHIYKPIPLEEVPIGAITNGVHTKSWLAPELAALYSQHLGDNWQEHISEEDTWNNVANIPDDTLWEVHRHLKTKMIEFVRQNIKEQKKRNREPIKKIMEVDNYLSPDVLTIGFARRFATYKRATLLFKDKQRLIRLINDPERPVQIIFAGKAHPADQAGKELIKQIYEAANEEAFKGKIIFLENYDINIARYLVQGVDLWLNNPRWPMEASGTSGMKAGVNGVLNCSVLDGWWPEGYNGENGFVIGEEKEYSSEEEQDRDDAYYLYSVLEDLVIPDYYDCNGGYSPKWLKRVKSCLASISWEFSTERMVKDYTTQYYVNCIQRWEEYSLNNCEIAAKMKGFKRFIQENWHHVVIQSVDIKGNDDMPVGEQLEIEAVVKLGPIWHKDVCVEIVCGREVNNLLEDIQLLSMEYVEQLSEGLHRYRASVDLPQGTYGYTVRVRPYSPYFANKFELPLVSWAANF